MIASTKPIFSKVLEGEVIIQAPRLGDCLHDFHGEKIKYCVYGSLDNPVNIVMGGISANAYVTNTETKDGKNINGWWHRSVGKSKTVDTDSHCVLGIEYLPNNKLAKKFFETNRSVSTSDQAKIVKYLLDALKIPKLHSFIGSSYGGMVALKFAELFPDNINKLIVLCASNQANSRTTAFRSIQRSIISLASEDKKNAAVSLARSLGMIVYRSHLEFEQRFRNKAVLKNEQWTFPVTDYIYSRGSSLAETFSPERFSILSESCDLHFAHPEKIKADSLIIGFDSDDIVKPQEIINLNNTIAGKSSYEILETIYGHDAFIVEQHRLANTISRHINS